MRKIKTAMYLERKQVANLKTISTKTFIPLAVLIRQGVDSVIKKYRKELRGKK